MATISSRIDVRTSQYDKAVLTRAAKVLGKSLSQFVLESTLKEAHSVIADNPQIQLSETQWEELQARLDNPVVDQAKLENLMRSPSIFADA